MPAKVGDRVGVLHTMTFRATSGLKERLERSASKNGRSLASEVAMRLELSLNDEDVLEVKRRIERDEATRQLCVGLSTAGNMVATDARASIVEDRPTRDAVFHAITMMLAIFENRHPLPPVDENDPHVARQRELLISIANLHAARVSDIPLDPAFMQGIVDQFGPYNQMESK